MKTAIYLWACLREGVPFAVAIIADIVHCGIVQLVSTLVS